MPLRVVSVAADSVGLASVAPLCTLLYGGIKYVSKQYRAVLKKRGGRGMCLTNVSFSLVYVSETQTMDGGDPRHSVNNICLDLLKWDMLSELIQMCFLKSSLQVSVSSRILTLNKRRDDKMLVLCRLD